MIGLETAAGATTTDKTEEMIMVGALCHSKAWGIQGWLPCKLSKPQIYLPHYKPRTSKLKGFFQLQTLVAVIDLVVTEMMVEEIIAQGTIVQETLGQEIREDKVKAIKDMVESSHVETTNKEITNNKKNKNQARVPAKAPAAKPEPEPVIVVPEIADEDVVIPDSLMDSVEKLRMREDVERNVADEDIGKLMVFCFTGKGYKCPICGIVLSKEAGMRHHLMGKSHVMKVIDARGNGGAKYKEARDILDIDLASDDWYEKSEKEQAILRKQAKLIMKAEKELEIKNKMEFDKNPANFFQVESSSIKTAQKDGTTITFTHLVETSMVMKDFAGDKFFGCEFVKAESGFNCRLCNQYIRDAGNVMKHIESKNHKNSYQNFLRKNPNYEKKQKQQNGDLSEALAAEENKNADDEDKADDDEKVEADDEMEVKDEIEGD